MTANDRFKQRWAIVSSNGLILAVAIHFAVFALFPRLTAADMGDVRPADLTRITPPPAPDLPPQPERIERPANPIITDVALDERPLPVTDPREWTREELLRPPETAPRDIAAAPVFVPTTVRPRLLNEDEVSRALVRGYPPTLRDAGIGGTAHIWFFLDTDGSVLQTRIDRSSGYAQLDEAALRVASVMRFAPAYNRTEPVRVWVSLPIRFEARTPQ